MIEKNASAPLDYTPDEVRSAKKPIFFLIGFIFSVLGLATPFLVFLIARTVYKLPCCGEGGAPGDGLGWMLLMIYGIVWWTLTILPGFVLTISGLARKERGWMKVPAIAAAVLSIVSLGLIYAATAALMMHNS